MALFTGAFLVFSVLSLSVAQRPPQFALLGVLGLTARERLALVLAESALLGVVGSVLGLALGTGLAALALRLLGGDLGGGYFPGVAPRAAVERGGGAASTARSAWSRRWSAAGCRRAPRSGSRRRRRSRAWAATAPSGARPGSGSALLALGARAGAAAAGRRHPAGRLRRRWPACWSAASPACRPASASLLRRRARRRAMRWRCWRWSARAPARHRDRRGRRRGREPGLAVALTVMVASFRDSVTHWLDAVLPADLYVRARPAARRQRHRVAAAGAAGAAPRASPGVARAEAQRVSSLQLDPARPAVALIARPLRRPGAQRCRWSASWSPRRPARRRSTSARRWSTCTAPRRAGASTLPLPDGRRADGVRARRLARLRAPVRRGGDRRRRLPAPHRRRARQRPALWLAPGARLGDGAAELRAARDADGHDGALLEFASPREIRATSLRIFDRSFAVTYWLQAVAIAIGLFGIAASFSAQVLARRKEFGLLAHLGLTRRQIARRGRRRRRGLDGRRRAARPRARAGGERGAGARGQPAELPLDHGPAAALGCGSARCAPRCSPPARSRPARRAAGGGAAERAGGEGRLVGARACDARGSRGPLAGKPSRAEVPSAFRTPRNLPCTVVQSPSGSPSWARQASSAPPRRSRCRSRPRSCADSRPEAAPTSWPASTPKGCAIASRRPPSSRTAPAPARASPSRR